MAAGPKFDNPSNLATVLPQVLAEESLRAASRPVYLLGLPSLFVQVERLTQALGLKRPLLSDAVQSGSFGFARLDVVAYQQAVARYRAAVVPQAGGPDKK